MSFGNGFQLFDMSVPYSKVVGSPDTAIVLPMPGFPQAPLGPIFFTLTGGWARATTPARFSVTLTFIQAGAGGPPKTLLTQTLTQSDSSGVISLSTSGVLKPDTSYLASSLLVQISVSTVVQFYGPTLSFSGIALESLGHPYAPVRGGNETQALTAYPIPQGSWSEILSVPLQTFKPGCGVMAVANLGQARDTTSAGPGTYTVRLRVEGAKGAAPMPKFRPNWPEGVFAQQQMSTSGTNAVIVGGFASPGPGLSYGSNVVVEVTTAVPNLVLDTPEASLFSLWEDHLVAGGPLIGYGVYGWDVYSDITGLIYPGRTPVPRFYHIDMGRPALAAPGGVMQSFASIGAAETYPNHNGYIIATLNNVAQQRMATVTLPYPMGGPLLLCASDRAFQVPGAAISANLSIQSYQGGVEAPPFECGILPGNSSATTVFIFQPN